jgi:hypothetical protein
MKNPAWHTIRSAPSAGQPGGPVLRARVSFQIREEPVMRIRLRFGIAVCVLIADIGVRAQ